MSALDNGSPSGQNFQMLAKVAVSLSAVDARLHVLDDANAQVMISDVPHFVHAKELA